MAYIFESPTEEQVEEILQHSHKIAQILPLGLKHGRLLNNINSGKKRLINTENDNYILQIPPLGRDDMSITKYLFYFEKECYLLSTPKYNFYDNNVYYYKEVPINLSEKKLQFFIQELVAMFKVGGKLIRENEDDHLRAAFIPEAILETTIEEF